ncbi:MAG TPA: carboxypeptidase-like regulatory domain-containing protein [Planctomycetota bacterium]|nr:carboxypeptidase-like regulatory domain-containing protein [Planctomycetota bacterium]
MRPLLVLLLVLAAALALIFTLQRSESPSQTIEPPTVLPETAKGPVETPKSSDVVTPTPVDPRVPTDNAPEAGAGVSTSAVELPGKNSLYGLVTNEQKQPLRGAKVELSREPRMGQEVAMLWMINERSSTAPTIVTMTDEQGKYRFTNQIPRRDYYLIVSHEGYSPTQEQLVAIGDQGEFQGPNVVLKTGSVVEGTVTDEAGNVIPNADLWLDSAFYNGQGESPDRLIAKSDNLGHYEFKNVYPVTKQVTCMSEGSGSQTKTPVNVIGTPGERVTVDFQLLVGQPIAGKVIGSDGMGIKGAKIVAYNTGNNISYRGEVDSDDEGNFQLLSLHPGMYILTCEAKGYRQQKHTRVTVGTMNVVIDMLAQACINGHAIDSNGNPVTAFSASVRRLAPNQVPGIGVPSEETGVKESFTDLADGNFQLCGLDPGTYTILASSSTSAPTFSEAFSISVANPTVSVTGRLSKGGSIKGRLVSPTGAPIGGVTVRTQDDTFDEDPTDLFGGMMPTNTTSRKVVTNSEGVFELKFLNPEKYQLRMDHPSYAQGKLRAVMVNDGSPTDVGTISMQIGGSVKGKAISQDGGPLVGGFVHLESDTSDLILDTRSDGEGRFSFAHVRPGNYTLSVTSDGTASGDAFGTINQMQRTQQQIVVVEGGELTRELTLSGG